MNYVLDTNVILFYLKGDQASSLIEHELKPFHEDNTAIISVVTIAEIGVLARRNNWGVRRIKIAEQLYRKLLIVDINSQDIIDAYIDVDSFSQGKHPSKKLKGSARNMGKNDVWIAATTIVTNSELITFDKDFAHLDDKFFKVRLLDTYF
ncbi:MAG: PIN domain-containing protein [Bacteroidota bacterium]